MDSPLGGASHDMTAVFVKRKDVRDIRCWEMVFILEGESFWTLGPGGCGGASNMG
jgi:hypothetical protein